MMKCNVASVVCLAALSIGAGGSPKRNRRHR